MSNFSLLSTEKMVSLTQYWTKDERAQLSAIPQAAGLLVNLDSLFKRLFIAVENDGKAEERARVIYKKQVGIDRSHDHLLRGVYYSISSQASFLTAMGDEEGARDLIELRDQLYPDGLAGMNLSYDEEAGAAELLERRITDDIAAKLSKVVAYQDELRTLSLLDQVNEQIKLAKELRSLEQEKNKAEAEAEAHPSPSRADARKVRLEWIETVRTLERSLRAAKRAGNINDDIEKKLTRDLQEAEAEAHKKYIEDKKAEALTPR